MSTAPRSSPTLIWSVAISLLVAAASLVGLLTDQVYALETANWATQARGQDLGNLVAVAFLLASAVLQRRGSARAGRIWLGTLLYLIYAYLVYAMAVHFNRLFLVYVAVLGLSAYAVILGFGHLTAQRFTPRSPGVRRAAGLTLLVTGLLFALLWLAEVVPALLSGAAPSSLTDAGLVANPIHVIDLSVVLPAFIITGLATLRGRSRGVFWSTPWLTFSVLMGASIVFGMLLAVAGGQPGTVPPMLLVSLVTLVSSVVLWASLARGRTAALPSPA